MIIKEKNPTSFSQDLWTWFLLTVKNSVSGSSETGEDYIISHCLIRQENIRGQIVKGVAQRHTHRSLLGVHQRHDGLQPRESVGPGVAEGCGAVLGQVLLPQETEQAQHPGVFDRLCEYPDMGWTLHIVMAVDQDCVPLHQPLQIHAVGQRQGGL